MGGNIVTMSRNATIEWSDAINTLNISPISRRFVLYCRFNRIHGASRSHFGRCSFYSVFISPWLAPLCRAVIRPFRCRRLRRRVNITEPILAISLWVIAVPKLVTLLILMRVMLLSPAELEINTEKILIHRARNEFVGTMFASPLVGSGLRVLEENVKQFLSWQCPYFNASFRRQFSSHGGHLAASPASSSSLASTVSRPPFRYFGFSSFTFANVHESVHEYAHEYIQVM